MKSSFQKRIDDNQTQIVNDLERIPGVSVAKDHDDILVTFRDRLYWFEIKNPLISIAKSGLVHVKYIKKSQIRIMRKFIGPYFIVWFLDDILHHLGIKQNPKLLCGHCWLQSFDSDPTCDLGDPKCHCERLF